MHAAIALAAVLPGPVGGGAHPAGSQVGRQRCVRLTGLTRANKAGLSDRYWVIGWVGALAAALDAELWLDRPCRVLNGKHNVVHRGCSAGESGTHGRGKHGRHHRKRLSCSTTWADYLDTPYALDGGACQRPAPGLLAGDVQPDVAHYEQMLALNGTTAPFVLNFLHDPYRSGFLQWIQTATTVQPRFPRRSAAIRATATELLTSLGLAGGAAYVFIHLRRGDDTSCNTTVPHVAAAVAAAVFGRHVIFSSNEHDGCYMDALQAALLAGGATNVVRGHIARGRCGADCRSGGLSCSCRARAARWNLADVSPPHRFASLPLHPPTPPLHTPPFTLCVFLQTDAETYASRYTDNYVFYLVLMELETRASYFIDFRRASRWCTSKEPP